MNHYLQDFLDHLYDQDKSEQTIRAYLADLSAFSRWIEEQTEDPFSPHIITPLDTVNYRRHLQDNKKSPATINRHIASLSSFCKWSCDMNFIPTNPIENIKGVSRESIGPKSLERREQLALIRAVQKTGKKRDLAIVNLLLHTGIRVGELCSLRKDDLIIEGRKAMIRISKGKGNKMRYVPLNSTALKSVISHVGISSNSRPVTPADSHMFYGQKERPLTERGVRHLIKKYAYNAKMPWVSPHTLRHTCAKNLIDAGQPIDRVAKILGHSSINTTAIYTMPTETDLQHAAESISWT